MARVQEPEHAPDLFPNLPPELRNMIWSLIVVEPQTLIVSEHKGSTPAVSRTCTMIREETLSIFYNANTFKVQVWDADIDRVLPQIRLWHEYHTPKLDEWDNLRNNIKSVDFCGRKDWTNFCDWAWRTWKGELPVLYDGGALEYVAHLGREKEVDRLVYLLKQLGDAAVGKGELQDYNARKIELELEDHWCLEWEEGRRWYD